MTSYICIYCGVESRQARATILDDVVIMAPARSFFIHGKCAEAIVGLLVMGQRWQHERWLTIPGR